MNMKIKEFKDLGATLVRSKSDEDQRQLKAKQIRELSRKSAAECTCVILDDRYVCSFTVPEGKLFKTWTLDDNCSRFTTDSDVNVYDKETKANFDGKILIACDEDLNDSYSISLMKYGSNGLAESLICCTKFEYNI